MDCVTHPIFYVIQEWYLSMGTNVAFIIIIIKCCLAAAFGRIFGTQAHETTEIRSQLNIHVV